MLTPPKNTRSPLTFSLSVFVGVYMGTRVTSLPWRMSSRASELSRMHDPQYMLAAPAVRARMRITSRCLKRAPRVQVIEQISFVWLIPRNVVRRNRPKVETPHVGRCEQLAFD